MEPTIMKQLNFKKIFLNLLWPLLPFTAQAQENNTLYSILSKDSILVSSPSVQNQEEDIVTQMPNRHHKYDKRVHRYRRAWEALIPTHTKLQYAGGMGLLSWGIAGIMEKEANGKPIFFWASSPATHPNISR